MHCIYMPWVSDQMQGCESSRVLAQNYIGLLILLQINCRWFTEHYNLFMLFPSTIGRTAPATTAAARAATPRRPILQQGYFNSPVLKVRLEMPLIHRSSKATNTGLSRLWMHVCCFPASH